MGRFPTVLGSVPRLRRWLICDLPWNFIGCSRSISNYSCGANLYSNRINSFALDLEKIPLHRHFYMLLLCEFLFNLSTYCAPYYMPHQVDCESTSAIFLEHLGAISLSYLAYYLIFTPGHCRYISTLWDFCGPYFLIVTRSP